MAFTAKEEAGLRDMLHVFQGRLPSMSDDVAVLATGAFADFDPSGHVYSAGERVNYNGVLYKCLQDHTSQVSWTPDSAASLWAKVLDAQAGVVPEWEQPSATNGYGMGIKVSHKGNVWESTQDANVWEPGAVGAPWRIVGLAAVRKK